MNAYLSQVKAIVWKDFVTELKTRELFSSMFVFAILVMLIFIFSINLSIVKANQVGPGVCGWLSCSRERSGSTVRLRWKRKTAVCRD